MPQKNILFISSWFPNRINIYNGDFVQRHAKAAALKNRVVMLYVKYDPAMHAGEQLVEKQDGSYHEMLVYFGIKKGPFAVIRKSLRYIKLYLGYYKQIRKKHFTPDLIHANITFPIGLLARYFHFRYRIPYVISEHWSAYLPVNNHKLSVFRKMLDRLVTRNARKMIPVTQNLGEALVGLKYTNAYSVVPNVVNLDQFSPSGKNTNSRTFIHLSTLNDPTKNISGMLQAAKKLAEKRTDFRLKLIGLENVSGYISKAEELGIYDRIVTVHEAIEHKEVPAYLKESMCLLMFSNFESLPCIIIEAMASGIPVISSDVGGINEYLTHNEGILVPAKEVDKLVEAMDYMLDHSNDYKQEHLRQHAVENFSPEAVGDKLDTIYTSILKNG